MTQGHGADFFKWITHDKGHGRKLVDFGEALELKGFERLGKFPNLTAAMERRGWKSDRIENVLGKNWLRHLGQCLGLTKRHSGICFSIPSSFSCPVLFHAQFFFIANVTRDLPV